MEFKLLKLMTYHSVTIKILTFCCQILFNCGQSDHTLPSMSYYTCLKMVIDVSETKQTEYFQKIKCLKT